LSRQKIPRVKESSSNTQSELDLLGQEITRVIESLTDMQSELDLLGQEIARDKELEQFAKKEKFDSRITKFEAIKEEIRNLIL
ncbi:12865_t:CDS:1, partial [Entrophospora sp. SA101]